MKLKAGDKIRIVVEDNRIFLEKANHRHLVHKTSTGNIAYANSQEHHVNIQKCHVNIFFLMLTN
jgi:hypothetical protein